MTWTEVVAKASSLEGFAAQMKSARSQWIERQATSAKKAASWLPESLSDSRWCGVACSREYEVRTLAELDKDLNLCGAKLTVDTFDFLDEFGRAEKGVLIATNRPRLLRFESATRLNVSTHIASSEGMLRPNQNVELFTHLSNDKQRALGKITPVSLADLSSQAELLKAAAAPTASAAPAAAPLAASQAAQEAAVIEPVVAEAEVSHVSASVLELGISSWGAVGDRVDGHGRGKARGAAQSRSTSRGAGRGRGAVRAAASPKIKGAGRSSSSIAPSAAGAARPSTSPEDLEALETLTQHSAMIAGTGMTGLASPTKKRRIANLFSPRQKQTKTQKKYMEELNATEALSGKTMKVARASFS